MKWLVAALLTLMLLLTGYTLYRTRRLEAQMKPRVQLIASVPHLHSGTVRN